MKPKPVIAIDFDGTIVTEAYPDIGQEIAGAIDSIKRIQELGAECVLWTCRSDQHLEDAVLWLSDRGVDLRYKNENTKEQMDYWKTNPRKIAADIYVDDRAVGGFKGWKNAIYEIEKYLSSVQPED